MASYFSMSSLRRNNSFRRADICGLVSLSIVRPEEYLMFYIQVKIAILFVNEECKTILLDFVWITFNGRDLPRELKFLPIR